MYIDVKPLKSYRIIDKVMPLQNAGKPLREQLRFAHQQLFKLLIRLLKKEIEKARKYGGVGYRGDRLHKVRANRKNLCGLLHVCEKTVYNLLSRLEDFKWVSKVWHGSNASFEVELNPSLLFIEDETLPHPGNVATKFASDLPDFRKTLPHTLPQVPWDTSKPNKLKGLPSDGDAAATPADTPDAGTPKRRDTDSGYHPSSENPATTVTAPMVAQDTKVPAAKKPKNLEELQELVPTLPRTMADVLATVAPKHRVWLEQRVDHVYEYALAELYQWFPAWIAPSVHAKARIALAEYFAYGNPQHWKRAALEFTKRIDMVCGYLERNTQKHLPAWLPLPHIWFDLRTRQAFADTKLWKNHETDPKVIWGRAEVEKAIILYWRALESKRMDADETLRGIRQRLQKRGGPGLVQQFERQFKTSYAARRGVA